MPRTAARTWALVGCGGVPFEERNNYAFSRTLSMSAVEVASHTELTVDWSALATDIRGREVTSPPEQVVFLKCEGSKSTILGRINGNRLVRSDCAEVLVVENASRTSQALAVATTFPANDPEVESWIVTIMGTSAPGGGVLMSTFVDVRDASESTTIPLRDGSASITADVDLSSAPAITGAGTKIDWSGVTTDAFGNDFDPLKGTQVLVARYDAADVSEIEDQFLLLEDNAVELYRMQAFGITAVDLAQAEDAAGTKFGGFTNEGIWLFGVTCPECLDPAPLLLAVVDAG